MNKHHIFTLLACVSLPLFALENNEQANKLQQPTSCWESRLARIKHHYKEWLRFTKKVTIAFGVHYTKSIVMNLLDRTPQTTYNPLAYGLRQSNATRQEREEALQLAGAYLCIAAGITHTMLEDADRPEESTQAHLIGWALASLAPKPRYLSHKKAEYHAWRRAQEEARRAAEEARREEERRCEIIRTHNARAITRQVTGQRMRPMTNIGAQLINEFLAPLAECSICNQEMRSNVSLTPCNHRFHRNCLRQWFTTNISHGTYTGVGLHSECPLCRADLGSFAQRTRSS